MLTSRTGLDHLWNLRRVRSERSNPQAPIVAQQIVRRRAAGEHVRYYRRELLISK